ncbi:MAG TPA: CRISPR-associated endonuclease Cas3'', partial [Acidobacteriota bacterium]|nr:CRISPR-associated endonuclease Cas3'' [Acidobacteriota bacterium]
MTYLAHTENSNGVPHELKDHLRSVGRLAAEFAAQMNPAMSEAARWAGLLHDLGKYRDEFQQYLRGHRESSIETHHAIYGAALTFQQRCIGPTLAIAGHHAGLHDWHQLAEELKADIKYCAQDQLAQLRERFVAELAELAEKIAEPDFIRTNPLSAELYVRMLFSSLVDADFLDTEAHYKLTSRLTRSLQPGESLQRIIAEKESKPRDGELNELRNQIFQQCLEAALNEPGFFSLTVPTGGGKTLAGMAFALAHAQRYELRRVIVVIPYLSIIEQNAAQYRRILDPERNGIVIENHSAVAPPEDTGEERPFKPFERHATDYAAENWDAPVIVTTSVQFIESLF